MIDSSESESIDENQGDKGRLQSERWPKIGLTHTSLADAKIQALYKGCITITGNYSSELQFECPEIVYDFISSRIANITHDETRDQEKRSIEDVNEQIEKFIAECFVGCIDYEIELSDDKNIVDTLCDIISSHDYHREGLNGEEIIEGLINRGYEEVEYLTKHNENIIHYKINDQPMFHFLRNILEEGSEDRKELTISSISLIEVQTLFMLILRVNKRVNIIGMNILGILLSNNETVSFTSFEWEELRTLKLEYSSICFTECKMEKLEKIFLKNCDLNINDVEIISKGKWPNLKVIRIEQKRAISNKKYSYLGSAEWKKLECLLIETTDQNQEDHFFIENFEGFFKFPELRELNLRNNEIEENTLSKIQKSNFCNLHRLDIEDCNISGKLLFHLNKNVGWSELKELYYGSETLKQNEIYEGLFNICQYPLPKLQLFSLSMMNLSKNAIKHFLKNDWVDLKVLNFCNFLFNSDYCVIQHESLRTLTKCHWNNLEKITLSQRLYDFEVDALFEMSWPNLRKIDFIYDIPYEHRKRIPLDEYEHQNKTPSKKLKKLFLKNFILRRREFGKLPKYGFVHDIQFLGIGKKN